jgi:ankyrin repeat protein
MTTSPILSWIRSACIFFFCISPLSSYASFWDDLFGEDPREDCESLFEAIKKERIENIERLLARGVSLEERDSEGLTPLLYTTTLLRIRHSSKEKLEKIALTLIQQGAFLEAADSEGNTSLLICCAPLSNSSKWDSLYSLAKILLEYGTNPEARNQEECTPFLVAARNGQIDILKALLERKVNTEARNKRQQTALMLAAEQDQVSIVNELLALGADIDARDDLGLTSLMFASYKGHIATLQTLLQNDADITATSTNDVAVITKEKTKLPVFDFHSKEFVNYTTRQIIIPSGSTALTFAEKCGGRGAQRILLNAWAKKRSRNGKSPDRIPENTH